MAIHPIEYRYGTPEMRAVWSEENRFACIVRAEVALACAASEFGLVPPVAADIIRESASRARLSRAKEIEVEINHDMMAIVKAIAEECGEAGGWIHYGATSNDILDTATGLQVKEALDLIDAKLRSLLAVLLERSLATKHLVCAARTHGQIGVPTTYGLRFAIWAAEISRHLDRLVELRPRVAVGQLTGAVGTQAALGEKGIEIQERMMEILGLSPVEVSNQVIARDRYAEYFMFLANIATTLDKIGITLRSLQRSEIAEVEEAFGKKQVGSSTMPHKRNPIRSEQVCGLARIIRASIEPALQNNTLWDERDLTNSSCERILFPEATILADHIIRLMTTVLETLTIREENVRKNLNLLHGINMAESVMMRLAEMGMDRQQAHELVRVASMEAIAAGISLGEVLGENKDVTACLSRNEIKALLDPERYTGTAVRQVERLEKRLLARHLKA
ncbi:MAG TPA: adenylosuccinate lyase [Methanoregulaceae archaeon]|nr:MAG: adenylosuccinate lyase [Methanolinea sp.]HON80825.1 adenylosuccinate lyase [Methanoregulaceae archaeon]HPD09560.1 adenylosuccinate lyase [Methanoregulaceae archaeon]HRT15231.1 adenylosuccinate lyase [Methanoregulaceae archaeon]HRU30802.1 adenylosuccinate lyase [Methanoregulaceae archaeon]